MLPYEVLSYTYKEKGPGKHYVFMGCNTNEHEQRTSIRARFCNLLKGFKALTERFKNARHRQNTIFNPTRAPLGLTSSTSNQTEPSQGGRNYQPRRTPSPTVLPLARSPGIRSC